MTSSVASFMRKSLRFNKGLKSEPENNTKNMSSSKKFVVFDFGGVLRVRTPERKVVIKELRARIKERLPEIKVPRSEGAFRKFILPTDWKETVGEGKLPRDKGFERGFEELGLPADSLENSQFIKEFTDMLDYEGKVVMEEMYHLLGRLRQNPNVGVGVLSNHSRELQSWLRDRYNLVPQFIDEDMVIVSSMILVRKPEVQCYQVLIDALTEKHPDFNPETDKGNILFVDNKIENCTAAEEIGLRAFHYVHDVHQPRESFSRLDTTINEFLGN